MTLSQSYIIFALTSLEERNNTLLKAKYNCLSNITCRKANIASGAAKIPIATPLISEEFSFSCFFWFFPSYGSDRAVAYDTKEKGRMAFPRLRGGSEFHDVGYDAQDNADDEKRSRNSVCEKTGIEDVRADPARRRLPFHVTRAEKIGGDESDRRHDPRDDYGGFGESHTADDVVRDHSADSDDGEQKR